MPFSKLSELPDHVRKLPEKAQKRWMSVFNSAYEGYDKDKDKQFDPKRTAAQNRDRFAFAVANATLPKKSVKEALREFGKILADGVPIMSMLGRGALLLSEMEGHPEKKRRKKGNHMGGVVKELLAGQRSISDLVEAALLEVANGMSYEQIMNAVRSAVADRFPGKPGEPSSVWPIEVFADRVIVRENGKLMEIPFEVEESGEAKLGQGRQVRVKYVPVRNG